MRPFQDLLVWQKAHELTLDVYRLTRAYPTEERFGLTSQTRRSASSVPGNISDGCGKRTLPQLRASLDFAGGSLSELEYWFILGRDLGFMSPDLYGARNDQLNEVRRLLLGFADWAATQITLQESSGE
ncbi:MAG: four helix bundle protein [Longimicrobiales bacterium]